MQEQEHAIAGTLQHYVRALNESNTEAVMRLYTEDGVFMPQNSPSSVGSAAIREAYEAVFRAIQLRVTFDIREVHQIAPEWAFVRTNSAGTVQVHATGETSAEANQEIFILQKVGGEWKIARYGFSTTNPPRA